MEIFVAKLERLKEIQKKATLARVVHHLGYDYDYMESFSMLEKKTKMPTKEILTISLDSEVVSTLKTLATEENLRLESCIEKQLSLALFGYWRQEVSN
jgi:hypothetical protein